MSGGGRFLASSHAFTLAEVLVTLGIIGVVSAMTVPSLMQNHQKKTYVTQLHKIYNEVQQMALQYMTDSNALNLSEAGINSQSKANEFVTKYFRIVQKCEKQLTPCFAEQYKTIDGNVVSGHTVNVNSYVLASGASIRALYNKVNDKVINIMVDTNGQKGPNILGRDMFFMALYNNGIIDTEISDTPTPPFTEEQRNSASGNWKPFGDILNDNWEMTY